MSWRGHGFTLPELLIAVVVVGVLAGLVYPSYQEQLRKANRADARAGLLQVAQALERCRTEHNVYNHPACPAGSRVSEQGLYTIVVDAAATGFSLTATPVAGRAQAADGQCGSLILTHTGAKSATGADAARCW